MFEGRLTRFLFHSNELRRSIGKPHFRAFLPGRSGRCSVFRTHELVDSDVWNLGETHVAPGRGTPVIARADLPDEVVLEVELTIEADEPPPRHHNLVGWSSDRAANQMRALSLANASTLAIDPDRRAA
jgi:hypothetical protein